MASTNSWLIFPKPNLQPKLRLFCFPYAGAGASVFYSWSNKLPSDIEVCAVQLPGRESRIAETPFTRLDPLIEALTPVLAPNLELPFAFFGHSVGALICFELACQLRRQKLPTPLHLFVSARRAPQIPLSQFPVHQLPEPAFVERIRHFSGTPWEVLQNPELMSLFLPILRADLAINETYVYQPEAPLSSSISAFGGFYDPEVTMEELDAWRDLTSSNFSLLMFPGDHFFIKSETNALLAAISEDLSRMIQSEHL